MPIDPNELEKIIKDAFPDANVEVLDTSGDSDHFDVKISSKAFTGKSRIEQHRMVQDLVKDKNIHAIAWKLSAV